MSLISSIRVPNEYNKGARILCIGESPGDTEERELKPFVGESGNILTATLLRAGIARTDVCLANLSQFRPQGNKFEILEGSTELRNGIEEICRFLIQHREINVIACLGSKPLYYITGKSSIFSYRGSILQSKPDFGNRKSIGTFHPSAVLRDRKLYPTFNFDIQRIKNDSNYSELKLPEREYVIDPRGIQLEEITQELCEADELAVDIETKKKSSHILCVGFASSPKKAVCIVNHQSTGEYHQAVQRILSSRAKKIYQFGTFDTEQLSINGFENAERNYHWDTMVAQHVLNPELPRGLDFLTSIYTREPYYKQEGRSALPSGDTKSWSLKTTKEKVWVYNAKDCCVTFEVKQGQVLDFGNDKDLLNTFNYKMSLIPVARHIMGNGMLIDQERRAEFEIALLKRWTKLQNIMNLLCDKEVNVRSPKLKDLLYGEFKLPVRRNRGAGITTDEDAIVSLITHCVDYITSLKREETKQEWNKKLIILKTILEIRGLRQLLSNYVTAKISSDGRLRSTYSYASVETGRGSASAYVDGTGVNSQTFPRSSVIVESNIEVSKQIMEQVNDDKDKAEAEEDASNGEVES